ncbi:MAG: type I-A CRISPR-associated protein Cas5 [Methanobacteriaceae archaeon]|jgi:CRISPR-associated Cas5-like protein|nr:type I-A CRISPR-associated protein Cas5 [Methanobacteriaceae archaeon]
MQWLKFTLHFPSFFSYRIPDYSSQYALGIPLPSPSTLKLGVISSAIKSTGKVSEGEKVFNVVKDAEVCVAPPEKIAINSFLIKRLKKRKEDLKLIPTFGIRDYVFFPDDIDIFVGSENIDSVAEYFSKMNYIGSSDSMVYVKSIEPKTPSENVIKAVDIDEFSDAAEKESYLVYPVKDINKNATFDQINSYSSKSSRKILDQKYYLINAKVSKGKNWKILDTRN